MEPDSTDAPPPYWVNPRWLGGTDAEPDETLTDDQQAQVTAKLKELQAIIELFDSDGWKILQSTVEDQIIGATERVLMRGITPAETENLRGQVAALTEMTRLPEQVKADRDRLHEALKGEDGR